MAPELHELADKHLPGRDPDEALIVERYAKRIASAETTVKAIHRDTRSTPAGRMRQSERMREQQRAREAIRNELVVELKQLAVKREAMLPGDATGVSQNGRDEHDHSLDRYKVYASTPRGRVYLGGCANLGDGQARMQWFQRLLENRPARA